jgi:hypothetical protein
VTNDVLHFSHILFYCVFVATWIAQGVKVVPGLPPVEPQFTTYCRIASHFEYALGVIFDQHKYERVIILEGE